MSDVGTREEEREQRRAYLRYNAKVASMAIRHGIKPEAVHQVLNHHATKLNEALARGQLTEADVEALPDEHWRASFKTYAALNPSVRSDPAPPLTTRELQRRTGTKW